MSFISKASVSTIDVLAPVGIRLFPLGRGSRTATATARPTGLMRTVAVLGAGGANELQAAPGGAQPSVRGHVVQARVGEVGG